MLSFNYNKIELTHAIELDFEGSVLVFCKNDLHSEQMPNKINITILDTCIDTIFLGGTSRTTLNAQKTLS